ncbi:MAG: hypothetical protein MJ071_07995 [Oscillospiraceae bacterium]|nr:hypothetical protein [Oscillospiraceae bacterium]
MKEQSSNDEQIVLHNILPPEEPEQPEEGFVPYSAEVEKDSYQRSKKKGIVLVILLILIIAFFVFGYVSKNQNFYQRTLRNLQFNYLQGEYADDTMDDDAGDLAKAISARAKGKRIDIQANAYVFDENGILFPTLSVYHYTDTSTKRILEARSGTSDSFLTKSSTIRSDGSITEKKKNNAWNQTYEVSIPNLTEICFGTESHDNFQFKCAAGFSANVNNQNYYCEIWLMENNSTDTTTYTTLYRYYSGERLAGVRVLKDTSTVMEVYDITDYSFN